MRWDEIQQATIDEVLDWAAHEPWGLAMSACAQDAQWHAEGDVWTHTELVCRKLTELTEWPGLTRREQLVLLFTGLLHDVAKPLTSELDQATGRVTSFKHAVVGERVARGILRDFECDLTTREEIARLVRYHGRPAFLAERAEPVHEVVKLSWLVNNRLLFLFAVADTRGRDTDVMDRPEENLHYWKLLAEEHGCFDRPYPFANDHARFLFFRQAEPNLHYVPYEDFSCTVTMVAGVPGSGKNHWLSLERPELPVVALDEVREELDVAPTEDQGRVAQLARERCRELLRAKTSFAFNATNILRMTRGRWLDLFHDYGARLEIVYVEPPLAQILRQNRSRPEPVPEKVIRKLVEKCEPPTWGECHNLVVTAGS